jgi:hypothetical protein
MMRKLFIIQLIVTFFFLCSNDSLAQTDNEKKTWWKVQSIDTMKYSRDLAREKSKDPSFDAIIEEQLKNIANTGATHVSIGTPYDDEFIPFLKRWVVVARKNNLNVWFRGNFSGWEQWFEYPQITREEHLKKTENFIKNNGDIFKSGDIFTACPECENGGPGDPRLTNDVEGFRKFLLDSKKIALKNFISQGQKDIETSYFSMNGDVAKLIMDKETTRELGGVVTVDHYVKDGKILADDIREYINLTNGKIVLGEFGAPIPDIHGQMTQEEQHEWISNALEEISQIDGIIGINYWTNIGGSTFLWEENGTPRKGINALQSYFSPVFIEGNIKNEIGQPISYTTIELLKYEHKSDINGMFSIKFPKPENLKTETTLNFSAPDYISAIQKINLAESSKHEMNLTKEHEGLFFKIRKFFFNLFN